MDGSPGTAGDGPVGRLGAFRGTRSGVLPRRAGIRWARRSRLGTPGAPPVSGVALVSPRFGLAPRLDEVAELGALPNSVVASGAVPDAGARPFPTSPSRPGATHL